MAVPVGAVRDHNERPSVIASAPHIAEGPRYCIVEAGAILSDAGFGDHLEDPPRGAGEVDDFVRSEEHTSELQALRHLVCRLLLETKHYPSAREAGTQRECALLRGAACRAAR